MSISLQHHPFYKFCANCSYFSFRHALATEKSTGNMTYNVHILRSVPSVDAVTQLSQYRCVPDDGYC